MSGSAHSPIGASSAYRWMACPGSVRLSKGMPNQSSLYAREGLAAHKLAETCLTKGTPPETFLDQAIQVEKIDVTVDEEMVEAVRTYLNAINGDHRAGDEVAVEARFDLSHFYPNLFGTNDCSLYRPSTGALFIYDLKYGRGVPVKVENNQQLLYYALGAATSKSNRRISSVEMVVVQPRCPHPDGPVRRWRIDAVDLLEWSADLVTAAKATDQEDAPLAAGSHCKFCPAAAVCPVLRDQALAVAQVEFSQPERQECPDPSTLNPEILARVLGQIGLVEDWIRRVKAFAHHEAEAGRVPPGFKLVAKRANRQWRDDAEIEQLLRQMKFTQADIYQRKLHTPAQLEKVFKAKKTKPAQVEKIMALVIRPTTGTTLVEESDSRPPRIPNAQEAFTAVT